MRLVGVAGLPIGVLCWNRSIRQVGYAGDPCAPGALRHYATDTETRLPARPDGASWPKAILRTEAGRDPHDRRMHDLVGE